MHGAGEKVVVRFMKEEEEKKEETGKSRATAEKFMFDFEAYAEQERRRIYTLMHAYAPLSTLPALPSSSSLSASDPFSSSLLLTPDRHRLLVLALLKQYLVHQAYARTLAAFEKMEPTPSAVSLHLLTPTAYTSSNSSNVAEDMVTV